MIRISYWARANRWQARILLITCFLLLYFTACYWGSEIRSTGFQFTRRYLLIIMTIYALFYFYYPSPSDKKRNGTTIFYNKVRIARFGLTACMFALMAFAGNRPEMLQPFSFYANEANAILPAKDSPSVHYSSPGQFRAMMRDENGKKLKFRERKRLLKNQLAAIQHSNASDGSKALLIALSIIIALGAFYGILALSCSLACNDMGGLAALVLIGGTTLIVFGLIKIIRQISRREGPAN